MRQSVFIVFFGILAGLFTGNAQQNSISVGYFRNPLSIPMELTANFGELRTDHWHMGLDLRTDGRENLPVFAAAEGYIAAIGIRPQSFGRFIIIKHANGYSTLYAHLNAFFPELESFVTSKQYEKESWAIELSFSPSDFPVTRGQYIANSGNTGGSLGAHLHFEIFNTETGKRVNPLLFGFPMVDDVPPQIRRLAVYDKSKSIYEQQPLYFDVKKTDTGYILKGGSLIKLKTSKPSFAISAVDQMAGTTNPNGIYSALLKQNDTAIVEFKLDSISYDETGYINAQIDYGHKVSGGSSLQQLAPLPGENSGLYRQINGTGVLNLTDTAIQKISIEVADVSGNTSVLSFFIQYVDSEKTNKTELEKPLYFIPNKKNLFDKLKGFRVELPADAIYDTLPVNSYYSLNIFKPPYISPRFQLSNPGFPVHSDFKVSIKPTVTIADSLKRKTVMLWHYGGAPRVKKVNWENDICTASFGDFGYFQLMVDTVAPVVLAPAKGDTLDLSPLSRIVFTPQDNLGVIKSFRAELNGQWICFTNDKSRSWIYTFDERCPYGTHELNVQVEDLVGNITVKHWWFKRGPYTPPPPKKKVYHKKGKYSSKSGKKKSTHSTTKKTSKYGSVKRRG